MSLALTRSGVGGRQTGLQEGRHGMSGMMGLMESEEVSQSRTGIGGGGKAQEPVEEDGSAIGRGNIHDFIGLGNEAAGVGRRCVHGSGQLFINNGGHCLPVLLEG